MPQNKYMMIIAIYPIIMLLCVFIALIMEKYTSGKYLEYKHKLKEQIYDKFIKRINPEINWYNPKETLEIEEVHRSLNSFINLKEKYKLANFNTIEHYETIILRMKKHAI